MATGYGKEKGIQVQPELLSLSLRIGGCLVHYLVEAGEGEDVLRCALRHTFCTNVGPDQRPCEQQQRMMPQPQKEILLDDLRDQNPRTTH